MVGHCGGEGLQKQGVIQVSCNFLRTAVHADSHKRRKVDWGGEGGAKIRKALKGPGNVISMEAQAKQSPQ